MMANINDMGLPQGLPEMLGNNAVNPYAAQHYANALPGQLSNYYVRPREMTAADLGLSLLQGWMLIGVSGFRWDVQSNAPYAFWLGADA
jgi:hypothetical protein